MERLLCKPVEVRHPAGAHRMKDAGESSQENAFQAQDKVGMIEKCTEAVREESNSRQRREQDRRGERWRQADELRVLPESTYKILTEEAFRKHRAGLHGAEQHSNKSNSQPCTIAMTVCAKQLSLRSGHDHNQLVSKLLRCLHGSNQRIRSTSDRNQKNLSVGRAGFHKKNLRSSETRRSSHNHVLLRSLSVVPTQRLQTVCVFRSQERCNTPILACEAWVVTQQRSSVWSHSDANGRVSDFVRYSEAHHKPQRRQPSFWRRKWHRLQIRSHIWHDCKHQELRQQ